MAIEVVRILREAKDNLTSMKTMFLDKEKVLNTLDQKTKKSANAVNANVVELISRIDKILEHFPNPVYSSEKISIEDVIGCICIFYGVTQQQLITRSGKRAIAFPRYMAMYILSSVLEPNYTLEVIAKSLGGYDHCTVIHAKEAIINAMFAYPERKVEFEAIMKMIGTLH